MESKVAQLKPIVNDKCKNQLKHHNSLHSVNYYDKGNKSYFNGMKSQGNKVLDRLGIEDQILFRVYGWGESKTPRHSCIHYGFERFVKDSANLFAVRHGDKTLTYQELDAAANDLAKILIENGIGKGSLVPLFVKRSIPMVVGILGILKAGAAYVPQDAAVSPKAQLDYVRETVDAKVILTLSGFKDKIGCPDNCLCIELDSYLETFQNDQSIQPLSPQALFHLPVNEKDTAFVIFTSGTTGKPNGVRVTHGNVTNVLLTSPANLDIRPGTKVSQILNIAFDMAAWEILGCLANGGTLVLKGDDIQSTVEQVDVVIATPSVLSSLDETRCLNVRKVAVAGEPCPLPLARRWSEICDFHNSCGPTETTIVNTLQQNYSGEDSLSIGKPTPNNTVYVLNEALQPCAIGEVGEMWAGGDCVTAGYVNNPKLTAERYRPDPFLGEGRLMFRTKDLGRWNEKGELEHFGRVDDQVKVKGFRVELDAVSSVLEKSKGCQHAVTLKFDSQNLVSFVAPTTVNTKEASDEVAKKLPYYCVPKYIFALDHLPMTPRGKVDKRLLLDMARSLLADKTADKNECEVQS